MSVSWLSVDCSLFAVSCLGGSILYCCSLLAVLVKISLPSAELFHSWPSWTRLIAVFWKSDLLASVILALLAFSIFSGDVQVLTPSRKDLHSAYILYGCQYRHHKIWRHQYRHHKVWKHQYRHHKVWKHQYRHHKVWKHQYRHHKAWRHASG